MVKRILLSMITHPVEAHQAEVPIQVSRKEKDLLVPTIIVVEAIQRTSLPTEIPIQEVLPEDLMKLPQLEIHQVE